MSVNKNSVYDLKVGIVTEVVQETATEKRFRIELENGEQLMYFPGQFVQVSFFGFGEAPISITSSPTQTGYFELCVREAGRVTRRIHSLCKNDKVGIRGPFGKGFPVNELKGRDLLFIAGGIGIVPLRSLINYALDERKDFGKINILMGCKDPESMLYKDEVRKWSELIGVNFLCTVDKGAPDWQGNVGLITNLIPGVDLDVPETYCIVCGPPVMYKYVIGKLKEKNISDNQILLSLERRMKCGVGKCGHCQINEMYCCQDGPVFYYDKIKKLEEAL
jgi:sulfite reductase subunit B